MVLRKCKHKCKVCKVCSACSAGHHRVNDDCELCISCERVGEMVLRNARVKPVIVRPHFLG